MGDKHSEIMSEMRRAHEALDRINQNVSGITPLPVVAALMCFMLALIVFA